MLSACHPSPLNCDQWVDVTDLVRKDKDRVGFPQKNSDLYNFGITLSEELIYFKDCMKTLILVSIKMKWYFRQLVLSCLILGSSCDCGQSNSFGCCVDQSFTKRN